MKKIFLLILLLAASGTARASGEITVVVGGGEAALHREALAAFYRGCAEGDPTLGLKSLSADSLTEFRLADGKSAGVLQRRMVKQAPRVLVAAGPEAMRALDGVTSVPIVYLMVPAPEEFSGNRANLTGVSMRLAPEPQLDAFFKSVPSAKRLGLIFDPGRSGGTVERIGRYCAARGIVLLARPADEPRRVPTLLAEMRGMIDAFWMLPDSTVVTPRTVESILSFSLANRIPVVAFSDKFLEFGAAFSVGVDDVAAGKQASGLVLQIMAASDGAPLPAPVAGRMQAKINRRIAAKLGLKIEAGGNYPRIPARSADGAAPGGRDTAEADIVPLIF